MTEPAIRARLRHLNNHFAGKMLHHVTYAEMSEFEAKRRADGVALRPR